MDMLRWYTRTPATEMIGKRVRSQRPLANSVCELPTGTLFEITAKFGGLDLKSEPCPKCGLQAFFRKVPAYYVELVSREEAGG